MTNGCTLETVQCPYELARNDFDVIKLSRLNLLEKRGKKKESRSNYTYRAHESYKRSMKENCQFRNNACAHELS